MAFTFDTSGVVYDDGTRPTGTWKAWGWTDLSPFAQGFVEGLFASLDQQHAGGNPMLRGVDGFRRIVGFSDLSPDALALILRDCEAFERTNGHAALKATGGNFWRLRQEGQFKGFPPLRPFLNDAGQICLEEVR